MSARLPRRAPAAPATDAAGGDPAVHALDEPPVAGDDGPEQVPARAWVTLVGLAVFVVAFGTCASTFMGN